MQLRDRMQSQHDLKVLDVRQPAEWQAGRVPGAMHIPGGELPARTNELPRDKPIAVYCASGYRSSVTVSVLKRSGHNMLCNVLGGFTAWKKRDLPIER